MTPPAEDRALADRAAVVDDIEQQAWRDLVQRAWALLDVECPNDPLTDELMAALDNTLNPGQNSANHGRAGLASKEALIMKLSEEQTGDAGEAIQLAALFERFAIDHEPYGWPAIQQHRLSRAAALLRAQAATVAGLRERLGECYVLAGADTDGDPPARHANDAVRAVRELRADYNEALEELHGKNGWKQRAEAAIAMLRDIDAHEDVEIRLPAEMVTLIESVAADADVTRDQAASVIAVLAIRRYAPHPTQPINPAAIDSRSIGAAAADELTLRQALHTMERCRAESGGQKRDAHIASVESALQQQGASQ